MARNWKYVGGKKSARNSLQAAVSAVSDGTDGETAIFNSETGELYDLSGNQLTVISSDQYRKVTELCALILVHFNSGVPVNVKGLAAACASLGGNLFRDTLAAFQEISKSLKAFEGGESGDSGSIESGND